MDNISCGIVEDLLPLYIEEVCSEESKQQVAAHLQICPNCQKKYHQMKSELGQNHSTDNLNDGQMIGKLADTWKRKTTVNLKASVICLVFYFLAVMMLPFAKSIGQSAYYRFETGYLLVAVLGGLAVFMLLGGVIAFLACRPYGSARTFMLEGLIIGLPAVVMVTCFWTFPYMPRTLQVGVMSNFQEIMGVGALLLGCELYRWIVRMRCKQENNGDKVRGK